LKETQKKATQKGSSSRANEFYKENQSHTLNLLCAGEVTLTTIPE
jgi:hypothetical protein